ncbi:MAG: glucose 1-dehydrogenase [Gammaproteobacteria bacterium]|jgi:NAD(P)-dependent dehydrogenase (short-subunit alcohol dehydrogenase family)
MSNTPLDGKTALITGASSGLGWNFALTMARAGADVAIAARRLEKLEALAAEIGETGRKAVPIQLDVTDTGNVEVAVEQAAAALGSLDILINNSGIAPAAAAIDVDEATWDRCLDTNLKGAWLVAQAAARQMIRGGKGGAIVNIASILSIRVQKGTAPYAISKAGLLQMTRALAIEWARYGIRVNALAPGYIATDISRDFLETEAGQRMAKSIPQRRFGQAEDLDGALLFLSSDASAYCTGVYLPVDGGHTLPLSG